MIIPTLERADTDLQHVDEFLEFVEGSENQFDALLSFWDNLHIL